LFKILFLLILSLLSLRFWLGGNEDVWLCQKGLWVKHGNPSYPKPLRHCDERIRLPKTKTECELSGGDWRKIGPRPIEECVLKTQDAGRYCQDNAECYGLCLAKISNTEQQELMSGKKLKRNGRCSLIYNKIGCLAMVEKGMIKMICID
jgi:hypothetical protein